MARAETGRKGARRRREILDAALACFLEKGIESTTLADVRERSGASTGSIYHLFASKEAIAGTLYLDSLRDLHERIVDRLRAGHDAEASVRGVVESYVSWVADAPERARFLFRAPREWATQTVEEELRAENRAFLGALKERMTEYVRAGQIRPLPHDLFVAVVLGPMQEWARQFLAGTARTIPRVAITELGTAAWNAVRATSK